MIRRILRSLLPPDPERARLHGMWVTERDAHATTRAELSRLREWRSTVAPELSRLRAEVAQLRAAQVEAPARLPVPLPGTVFCLRSTPTVRYTVERVTGDHVYATDGSMAPAHHWTAANIEILSTPTEDVGDPDSEQETP